MVQKMKKTAEDYLGQTVTEILRFRHISAIHSGGLQKKQASAGLKVRIINEPAAPACGSIKARH
jgi:hypothetical protein